LLKVIPVNDGSFSPTIIYAIVSQIVSIPSAFALEARRVKRSAETKPYTWGYYFGCSCLCWFPLGLLGVYVWITGSPNVGLFALWFIAIGTSGVFIIRRRRWAWVVGTILCFNPVFFRAHYVYAKNRWAELGAEEGDGNLVLLTHWNRFRNHWNRFRWQPRVEHSNGFKTCPFCNEQIREKAVKCRYCGEWINNPQGNTRSTSGGSSSTSAVELSPPTSRPSRPTVSVSDEKVAQEPATTSKQRARVIVPRRQEQQRTDASSQATANSPSTVLSPVVIEQRQSSGLSQGKQQGSQTARTVGKWVAGCAVGLCAAAWGAGPLLKGFGTFSDFMTYGDEDPRNRMERIRNSDTYQLGDYVSNFWNKAFWKSPQQPTTLAESARPPLWRDFEATPEYQAEDPVRKLVTFARWRDMAYKYNSMQPGWETVKDDFNKRAADKQADLGRAARAAFLDGHFFTSPMSPDEARYRIAQEILAANPNATLEPDIKAVYEKGPPAGMVESQSK
jgi:hypothetical protein